MKNIATALGCTGGTCGPVTCDWCGIKHNPCPKGYDVCKNCSDERCHVIHDDVSFIQFGDKQICDCCFDKLADAIAGILPSFLPEYKKALKQRAKLINEQLNRVNEIIE